MLKQTFALSSFAFLVGCGDSPDIARDTPPTSNTVLRGTPDFEPKPGDLPIPNDTDVSGTEFRIHIASNGDLRRNGSAISQAEIIDELRGTPNANEFLVILEGDPDTRVALVSKLQTDLSDAVPDLGTVLIKVADTPNRK